MASKDEAVPIDYLKRAKIKTQPDTMRIEAGALDALIDIAESLRDIRKLLKAQNSKP